jgi:hypothetical protein
MTFHGYTRQQLFHSMTGLSQLQELDLASVRVEPPDDAELTAGKKGKRIRFYTLADVLQHMPQLTYLRLHSQKGCDLNYRNHPGAIGAAVVGLLHLQHLELGGLDKPDAAPHTLFRQLPASITSLRVSV